MQSSMLRAGLFATTVLMHASLTQSACADGLIYQLPADGTSVRYDTEITATNQEKTSKGSLTVSSVGQTTVNNEKCRWIEFKNVTKSDQGDRIIIAKCLIPEKNLGKDKSPGEHMIRGWIKRGEMDSVAISDLKPEPGPIMMLVGYLAGPAPNAKELDKIEIDGPLGKLACLGVTGGQEFQRANGTLHISFEARLHEKAPFGVVTAVSIIEFKTNAQVMGTRMTKMTLAETNTTALTELPDKN